MARQTNAAITYNDANYMILNEGFSLKDTSITGNKCVTKEEVIDYMNVDEARLTSYTDNQLVPYHLLSPEVNTCCAPIFTDIQDYSATQIALNWEVSTIGCSAHNTVTASSSTDLVNWVNSTGDPNTPRIYTKPNVLTYYRLKAHCSDGNSEWSDTKSYDPTPPTVSPITLDMYQNLDSAYTLDIADGSASQSITVEFTLTEANLNSNAYIDIEGNSLDTVGTKVVVNTTLPAGSTGVSIPILLKEGSTGNTAKVTAKLLTATVDGVPTSNTRIANFTIANSPVEIEIIPKFNDLATITVTNLFGNPQSSILRVTVLALDVQDTGTAGVVVDSTGALLTAVGQHSDITVMGAGSSSTFEEFTGLSYINPGDTATVRYEIISLENDPIPNPAYVDYDFSIPNINDTTPPSIPQNLSGTNNGSSISLDWDDSTDEVGGSGMSHYELWRSKGWDDGNIASNPYPEYYKTITSSNYTDTDLSFEGPGTRWMNYLVKAVDNAGNVSNASSRIKVYE